MTWRVTYRKKDGKQTSKNVEAISRESLFGILTQMGISAIKIENLEATRNRQKNTRNNHRDVNPRFIIYAVVSLLAIISGIYYCCNSMNSHTTSSKEKASTGTTIHKEKAYTILPAIHTSKHTFNNPPPNPEAPPYIEVDGRKVYRNPTNDVGRVVTNAFGKALVIEHVVTPNGPMKDGKSLVPRRIFKYDSEVAIDCLMNMDIGYKSLMMLPPDMDQDFINSLTAKIEIEPEDTEDEIRRKQDMIAIKKELAERVAAGEKVSQIAAETLAHYNKIADLRDNLQQEIIEMEKKGVTEEEIEEIYEAANVMLKEYDALPLHSPKVRKAIIRERLERKKALQQRAN